ncbi:hypothetical protein FHX42_002905 [Saccharopolyspora lacisalsi]|uniref:Uncharacterized protein n=1 Tax=Halosaccharopolyspora lacisalsi TaxID=1000566 RepID=A0A839DVM9_9PSEU|nr:hypothetical protein [Halosaccharopolyspora lacisalsi]MBA8825554.1 hypothetical protein [Halosaccharopolyspora lacisalsi]
MRLDDAVSRRLVGDELTVEHASGRTERTHVPPEHLEDTLRGLVLVLVLGTAELDALRARIG